MPRPVVKFTIFAFLVALIAWIVSQARNSEVWNEEKWHNLGN